MWRAFVFGLAVLGASKVGFAQVQQQPVSPSLTPSSPRNDDEAAARRTLERAGYRDIRGLQPNGDGGWRGNASRNGIDVRVRIDRRGYIIER